MEISKYELIEAFDPRNPVTQETEKWGGQRWLIRRKRDAKLFLARELHSSKRSLEEVENSIKAILDHSNIVGIKDVVWDYSRCNTGFDYTVHDYCSDGSLNNLFQHSIEPTGQEMWLPESLCWHVLDGVSKALMWLHYGLKIEPSLQKLINWDYDWQSVYMMQLEPENVFFKKPKNGQLYGKVKLGNFHFTRIAVAQGAPVMQPSFVFDRRSCNPPEIETARSPWTTQAEIFCLGALIYRMMTGMKLVLERKVETTTTIGSLPTDSSRELRSLIRQMLDIDPANRPHARELASRVDSGISFWSDKTEDGRRYVTAQNGVSHRMHPIEQSLK